MTINFNLTIKSISFSLYWLYNHLIIPRMMVFLRFVLCVPAVDVLPFLFCCIEIKHYSLHKYGQIKYA